MLDGFLLETGIFRHSSGLVGNDSPSILLPRINEGIYSMIHLHAPRIMLQYDEQNYPMPYYEIAYMYAASIYSGIGLL